MRKIPFGFLLSTAAIVHLSLATAHAQTTTAPLKAAPPATAPAAAPPDPPPPTVTKEPAAAPESAATKDPAATPEPPAAPQTPEAPAPVAPPRPPAPRHPTVTLLATSPETVLQEKDQGRDWLTVCRGRCERRQDPTTLYRVGGRGLIPSQPFSLPGGTEQVEIKARMGSKAARIGGTIVGIGGLVSFALNGFAYAVVGDSTNSNGMKFDRDPLVVGMIIGGLGAVVGLLVAATSSTSVQVHDHLSPPAPVE